MSSRGSQFNEHSVQRSHKVIFVSTSPTKITVTTHAGLKINNVQIISKELKNRGKNMLFRRSRRTSRKVLPTKCIGLLMARPLKTVIVDGANVVMLLITSKEHHGGKRHQRKERVKKLNISDMKCVYKHDSPLHVENTVYTREK